MTPPLHAFRAQGFSGLYAVGTDVYLFLRVEDIAFAWCQLLPQVEYTERGYPFVSIQTWEGLLEKIRQCVAPAESDDDDALVSARTSNVPLGPQETTKQYCTRKKHQQSLKKKLVS